MFHRNDNSAVTTLACCILVSGTIYKTWNMVHCSVSTLHCNLTLTQTQRQVQVMAMVQTLLSSGVWRLGLEMTHLCIQTRADGKLYIIACKKSYYEL